ncbi:MULTISPECIES: response regulator [unclassified Duganella]|uniref:response regulator n=1 Tax=unclassified Duganella TaxID=2636909 RepID=UPI00070219F1|nr:MULTISPECIES: response regulator [unclassified Duganella]KQV46725.1 response regulator receiver protein [Duganella sp. Root336D2]KRC00956.1 response regulator receiver protein [Duganella sp. Root198D2]
MARILIIEDSPANMELATVLLSSAGHELFHADRARPGIEIARQQSLDLILMDIQMPEMDGIQAAGILRADPRTQAIPLVALTALAMKGDRERLMQAGFDAYIEKPIDYRQFLVQVAQLTVR